MDSLFLYLCEFQFNALELVQAKTEFLAIVAVWTKSRRFALFRNWLSIRSELGRAFFVLAFVLQHRSNKMNETN